MLPHVSLCLYAPTFALAVFEQVQIGLLYYYIIFYLFIILNDQY